MEISILFIMAILFVVMATSSVFVVLRLMDIAESLHSISRNTYLTNIELGNITAHAVRYPVRSMSGRPGCEEIRGVHNKII